MDDHRTPRRSPEPGERKRDAGRTRAQILDAALVEFGEHGFAGARTGAIAARAGVNQQLISYYFGGKAGLYTAVQRQWPAIGAPLRDGELAEVVANFVRAGAAQRSWGRMLVWGELTGDVGDGDAEENSDGYFADMVAELQARKGRGELADDLDPPYVMLALFAAALAPHLLPRIARRMTGLAPDAPELVERYSEQLALIAKKLRA